MRSLSQKKLNRLKLSPETWQEVVAVVGDPVNKKAGTVCFLSEHFRKLTAHAHLIAKEGREIVATEILLFLHTLENMPAADADPEEREIPGVPTDDHGTGGGRHVFRGTKYLT